MLFSVRFASLKSTKQYRQEGTQLRVRREALGRGAVVHEIGAAEKETALVNCFRPRARIALQRQAIRKFSIQVPDCE
jgi:hypothetical protein